MKRSVSLLNTAILLNAGENPGHRGCVHTHSVLGVDTGPVVDQELNTVEVSGPHRNMKRAAVQLDTVEQAEQEGSCDTGRGEQPQDRCTCNCGALT